MSCLQGRCRNGLGPFLLTSPGTAGVCGIMGPRSSQIRALVPHPSRLSRKEGGIVDCSGFVDMRGFCTTCILLKRQKVSVDISSSSTLWGPRDLDSLMIWFFAKCRPLPSTTRFELVGKLRSVDGTNFWSSPSSELVSKNFHQISYQKEPSRLCRSCFT